MAKKIKDNHLKALFSGKQKSMLAELGALRKGVFHAPTMGDGNESKWNNFLSEHLPSRYRVEKAFVVDSRGSFSEQIDCVIYDRQYSNLVFNQNGVRYVPAESVYAAIELKQTINKPFLEYAGKKIESVRKLHRTSVAVTQITGKAKKKKLKPIIGGLIAVESDYSPAFSAAFRRTLESLKGQKKIDLIYSLKDGLSTDSKNNEIGLMLLLNELLSRLQIIGNPPAIDYRAYSRLVRK